MNPKNKKDLAEIQEIAEKSKTPIYLVGGFLRDLALGRSTQDFDLALPGNVDLISKKAARALKAARVVLAEEEQIFRVVPKGGAYFDFAKFKGPTIEKDLAARDFTINAMAIPLGDLLKPGAEKLGIKNPAVLDPHGGKKDLEKKIVRQVSERTFEDDPLRMLRAFRFAAQLGFDIDKKTLEPIRRLKKRITEAAGERIREELLHLLDNRNAYETILACDQTGLLDEIFPEISANRACATDYYPGKGVWGHSMDGLHRLEWIFENLDTEFAGNAERLKELFFHKGKDTEGHLRSAIMKLGVLLHDIGKAPTAKMIDGRLRFHQHEYVGARMARKITERLKFSWNAGQAVSGLVLSHMRPGGLAHVPALTDRAKYRFFRDLGDLALPMLVVALADRYTYLEPKDLGKQKDLHEKSTKDLVKWHFHQLDTKPARKVKLVDGKVLMKHLKLKPSPLIGKLLKELDEAIATGEVKTRKEALEAAGEFLKNLQSDSNKTL